MTLLVDSDCIDTNANVRQITIAIAHLPGETIIQYEWGQNPSVQHVQMNKNYYIVNSLMWRNHCHNTETSLYYNKPRTSVNK